MKIGFIGLGIMGGRMAANLQNAGYELVVYNRTKDKAQTLIDNGAVWAETPLAAAKQVDILLTMLAHPEAIRETALGENGFLNGMQPDALWLDCSTVNPSFVRQMAAEAEARRVRFLEAPVAGTKPHAEKGELTFLVGGDAADVALCQPLFELMGSRVVHMGTHGRGTSLKLVLNHLLATSMAAFAEGMVLGQALGLEQGTLLNVLVGGPVTPPYMGMKRANLENGDYEADFPLQWMQKDMQMVATAAYESGVPMPLANLTKELYQLAIQAGWGEEDFSAVYQFMQGGRLS